MINNFKKLNQFSQLVFIEGKERRLDPALIKLEVSIAALLAEQRSLIKIIDYEKFNADDLKDDLLRLYRAQ